MGASTHSSKNWHDLEIFSKISRNFHEIFQIFVNLSKFFEVFGGSETCWDLFGPTRMHSDTFGYVGKRSEAFGRFRNFSDFFRFFSRLCQIPAKPMTKCVSPHVPTAPKISEMCSLKPFSCLFVVCCCCSTRKNQNRLRR